MIALSIPARYDGRPVPLRRIETRAVKDGLLADLATHPELDLGVLAFREEAHDPDLLRRIAARLFGHFTGEVLEERFLLEIMPPGLAGELADEFSGGFNV